MSAHTICRLSWLLRNFLMNSLLTLVVVRFSPCAKVSSRAASTARHFTLSRQFSTHWQYLAVLVNPKVKTVKCSRARPTRNHNLSSKSITLLHKSEAGLLIRDRNLHPFFFPNNSSICYGSGHCPIIANKYSRVPFAIQAKLAWCEMRL